MNTLLILGSKPKPALPPPASYQEVACANGSGYSAALYGLPRPAFTVMTPILASGSEAGAQTLQGADRSFHRHRIFFAQKKSRLARICTPPSRHQDV